MDQIIRVQLTSKIVAKTHVPTKFTRIYSFKEVKASLKYIFGLNKAFEQLQKTDFNISEQV